MNTMTSNISARALVMSVAFLFSCTLASPALAQSDPDPTSFGGGLESVGKIAQKNELGKARSAKEIIQSIVKWMLSLIGTIAVISLLYGGFLYITSQGDESKVEQAKSIILYSFIGILIIGLSAVIVNVVISLTQV